MGKYLGIYTLKYTVVLFRSKHCYTSDQNKTNLNLSIYVLRYLPILKL